MPGIGIGVGIGMKRVGKPYPTEGLQVIVYNSTYEEEGTTYLRTSTGVGIPKVSGTGNDTIWDFSVLNDLRLNKNAYVGTSHTDGEGDPLPEYYNSPWPDHFYYDELNPYHWKLTDFHYANLLAQTVDETIKNNFFLKAKATTETSNEIDTIYQLNIYESVQTGGALTKLKTWMRIAPKFYGNNTVINGTIDLDTNDDGLADNFTSNRVIPSIVTGNGFDGNAQKITLEPGQTNGFIKNSGGAYESGFTYRVKFKYRSNASTRVVNTFNIIKEVNLGNPIQVDEEQSVSSDFNIAIYCFGSAGDWSEIDDIEFYRVYENYYKS